jgi:hypothetical protein
MKYLMLAFAFFLIVVTPLNLNAELINPNEIDKIFNNLTPDTIGGKENSDENRAEIINLKSFN